MKTQQLISSFFILCFTALGACKDDSYRPEPAPVKTARGLFIVNQGNFASSNASLSFYDPKTRQVDQEIFYRANGIRLGEVPQSMTIRDSLGYIVVNNSAVIFVIHADTYKLVGKITGFTSPRYIHFVNDQKAYVSDMYAFNIAIVNPQQLKITGRIDVRIPQKVQPSTEEMVQYKNFVFVNCWSYDNKILVIDTNTDQVVDHIKVGVQPVSVTLDKNNKIWTMTDGGYPENPVGYEAPALYRIDAETRKIEQVYSLKLGEAGSAVRLNGTRDTLYYINKHVWCMSVTDTVLPTKPFIENTTSHYWYGHAVDPRTSELYLADAIDYVQPGRVYRYSPAGALLDEFKAGVIPGSFCFKPGR